jgi:hypothetical protein
MTLDESLATDYDGTLRFTPAWPSGWDASGTVYVQGGSKVDVQVEGGTLATAAIAAGTTGTMTVRNPWPGQQAEVVNGSTAAVVIAPTSDAILSVPVTAGQSYLVEQPSSPTTSLPFAQVTGTQATKAKHLGGVQIGLDGGSGTGGGATGPITSGANSAKCVDDNGQSSANGTKIQIWDCNGGANQSWTVASNGTLQVYGKCLDITGASTANGALIELWQCTGGANQQWQASNGELVNPASGKCLDDPGSNTANGTQLDLWTCNSGTNQQWHLP